jgi:Zn-dependent protease
MPMLGNVAPTPFDLNFSLFGIPVRIHPFFWLVSALLGWNARDPRITIIWIVCVFISILVHELGHALTAQSYGWPPHIVLYSFGGYASFQPSWGYTTARAILVLAAGPGAGFVLYGVVRAVEHLLIHQDIAIPYYALVAIDKMEFINLWWGLVNLLPVYPLDGGQISREALSWWRPHDGFDISLKISLVFAALAAYFLFTRGMTFNALLFGSLAFDNLQMLQRGRFR